MTANASLIADLEDAISHGTSERRLRTLRRVTDLFTGKANEYSADQIELFGEVIQRLAADIEIKARAELAGQLAPVDVAPVKIIRELAGDEAIEVAGPVLAKSARLSEQDLMAAATSKGQAHLLAISQRRSISEALTDVLVTRGDQDVVRSVAGNGGARFSDESFGKLVKRAEHDDVLAVRAATREDIQPRHFHMLVTQASIVVLNKLVASSPHLAPQLQEILAKIAGAVEAEARLTPRDYSTALQTVMPLHQVGKLGEAEVANFARAGRFEETAVSLSALCRLPIEAIEQAMLEKGDLVFIITRAAGLSWPTARSVGMLPDGKRWATVEEVEDAKYNFERLKPATAQRVIRFHQARQAASKAFA